MRYTNRRLPLPLPLFSLAARSWIIRTETLTYSIKVGQIYVFFLIFPGSVETQVS